MITTNSAFEALLGKMIDEAAAEQKDKIAAGMMEPGEYKFQCGVLNGMEAVRSYFPEVNKKLDER